MIIASQLVEKFKYALDNDWGYILSGALTVRRGRRKSRMPPRENRPSNTVSNGLVIKLRTAPGCSSGRSSSSISTSTTAQIPSGRNTVPHRVNWSKATAMTVSNCAPELRCFCWMKQADIISESMPGMKRSLKRKALSGAWSRQSPVIGTNGANSKMLTIQNTRKNRMEISESLH